LRERREDIPLLAEAFVERTRLKTRKPVAGLGKEALELLMKHDWPGNVRELINAVEYAFMLCPEGYILPEHLPVTSARRPAISGPPQARVAARPRQGDAGEGFKKSWREDERGRQDFGGKPRYLVEVAKIS
jgi:DNA-binding NtrC family response regulator